MADFEVVESLEAPHNLHEIVPDLLLIHLGSILLVLLYHLEQVAVVSVFHYDAKVAGGRLKEGVFVPDDVRMLDRC